MRALLPLTAFVLVLAGCERCAPDLVAAGAARLSVRSAAAVATLVDNDGACGFHSPSAVVSVDGDAGGRGTVTTTVLGCTLDLSSGALVSEDCAGTKTTASGKITVSARKIIVGHVAGDERNPVIPEGSASVSIVLDDVVADAFSVVDSKSNARFTIDGTFTATVKPLLFADDASGLCVIPSRNAIVAALTFGPATLVHVDADGRSFDVDVAASDLTAHAGVTPGGENTLTGTMTVFGSPQTVDAALDPDYDAEAFAETWSCAAGLAQPLRSSCSAAQGLAENGARLTVRTLGAIVKLIEADDGCGFANAGVLSRGAVEGALGRDGASITYAIAKPCLIDVPEDIVLDIDCLDNETRVHGSVSVTGTKRIVGWSTGNTATPVVPSSRDAVRFDLVADLRGLTVTATGQPSLRADEGLLSVRVLPRTAQDTGNGACSRPTPGARFEQLALAGGALAIGTDDIEMALELELSAVEAQNGPGAVSENTLVGDAVVDGAARHFDVPLDPAYDGVDFQSAFICEEGLLIPLDDDLCTFKAPLGQLTARGVFDLIDAATGLLLADPSCSDGDIACALGPFDDAVAAVDCTSETRASGSFTATVARTLDTSAPDGSTLVLGPLSLDGFTASTMRPGVDDEEADAVLTLTGDVTASVALGAAERSDGAGGGTGTFDVNTPVRRYTDVIIEAQGTVVVDGLTFFFTVSTSDLDGVRGALGDEENVLTGTIVVDAQLVEIPVDRRDRSLEPSYDAAAFVDRYACEVGFFAPVP
jgi:hypothetical protein